MVQTKPLPVLAVQTALLAVPALRTKLLPVLAVQTKLLAAPAVQTALLPVLAVGAGLLTTPAVQTVPALPDLSNPIPRPRRSRFRVDAGPDEDS